MNQQLTKAADNCCFLLLFYVGFYVGFFVKYLKII